MTNAEIYLKLSYMSKELEKLSENIEGLMESYRNGDSTFDSTALTKLFNLTINEGRVRRGNDDLLREFEAKIKTK